MDEAGDRPTLVVRGEIDVSTSPELRAQLGRLLEHQPSGIVVDLRGVGFVDSSGLGVLDFMKRTSILKCGPDQLRALGPAAMTLGKAEGLDAHARSIGLRLNLP